MSPTTSAVSVGMVVGLLLAIAAAVGGFSAFALAVFLGAVGALVGAQVSGRVDVLGWLQSRTGKSRG